MAQAKVVLTGETRMPKPKKSAVPIADKSGFKKVRVKMGPVVKIDGVAFQTYIVGKVQRLPCNEHLRALTKSETAPENPYMIVKKAVIDLNDLCIAAEEKKSIRAARKWIYQRIGYSVCGYSEVYPEAKIENPLWD